MSFKEEFIREYTKAVSQGYAAVFAGAGLSRQMGFINWKELIEPLAKDIGLDINKEHDLIAIAQYYKNEKNSRSGINEKILNEFTKDVELNENIRILTRLPIQTYWTTNYDQLLEEALKENNRKADVKIKQESLASNVYDRDAVVYKMHGDVSYPSEAVLTKDDYEVYSEKHPLFRTVLRGDLVSKTFLFIGFSFEDPNLDYVLSQIRVLLGENKRDHYCFFEKIKKGDTESKEDFEYNKAKQALRIKDLQRYGIQAILLDSYNEITEILNQVEQAHLMKNIFISGSINSPEGSWDKDKILEFTHNLSKFLVKNNYKIISGFGLGIGSSIINGALEEIMTTKYKHIDEHLSLRPFPQIASGKLSREELWRKYRENMISQAGIVIFIFGNKCVDNEIVPANGLLEEFDIACQLGKKIIPVGSTEGAAKIIYKKIEKDIDKHSYLKKHIIDLEKETDVNKLVKLIYKIVKEQQIE